MSYFNTLGDVFPKLTEFGSDHPYFSSIFPIFKLISDGEQLDFAEDAKVLTPDGWRTIQSLSIGDAISSFCLRNNRIVSDRVTYIEKRKISRYLQLTTEDMTIKTTRNQSFRTLEGWKKARLLEEGDTLITAHGRYQKILDISHEKGFLNAYHIEVEQVDNYIVEELLTKTSNEATYRALKGATIRLLSLNPLLRPVLSSGSRRHH